MIVTVIISPNIEYSVTDVGKSEQRQNHNKDNLQDGNCCRSESLDKDPDPQFGHSAEPFYAYDNSMYFPRL